MISSVELRDRTFKVNALTQSHIIVTGTMQYLTHRSKVAQMMRRSFRVKKMKIRWTLKEMIKSHSRNSLKRLRKVFGCLRNKHRRDLMSQVLRGVCLKRVIQMRDFQLYDKAMKSSRSKMRPMTKTSSTTPTITVSLLQVDICTSLMPKVKKSNTTPALSTTRLLRR